VNTKYNRTTSARLAVVFTALLTTIFMGRPAAAETINLAWDANPEPEVVGYIVHVGTQSSTYTQHVDVGPATTWAFASAVAGQQYCFAVSAYFAGPAEGPKSTEICGFSNAPPALVNPGAQSSTVGEPDTLQLAGSDPKGDPVTYTATGLPPGLTLMASTGFISGTPTTAGTYSVTGAASDGVLTASQAFTWTVAAADTTAPVVAITGPTSAATYTTTGLTLTLNGSASDAVGVTQVSWVNSRGGSGTATGTTSWTASAITLQAGSNVVTVSARDAAGNASSDVLTVTVNLPPTIGSVANQSSDVGLATTLQLVGSDPNGDALTYTATGLPPGLTVGVSSGLIAGTPSAAGTYSVTVSVSDGALSASRVFTWTIAALDTTAPVVAITGPTSAAAVVVSASAMTLSGTASDSVGVTQVTWENNRGGSGAATGTTSWSAAGVVLQSGVNVLTVTARDGAGNVSTDVLTATLNTAPTLAPVPNQSTEQATAASLQLAGADPDGGTLSYGANGLPPGLAIAVSTGLIAGTPTTPGSYPVTVTVSDGALTATRAFTWTVTVEAGMPQVAITTPTTAVAFSTGTSTITLAGTASDNVGVTQVSWVNSRGGSGTATGTSSWSAAGIALQGGVNDLTVTARDAAGNTSTDVLSVTYSAGDTTAPAVAITSPTTAATIVSTKSTITLRGSASDNVAVTQVTWHNDRGGNGIATGTKSWSKTGLALQEGVNVLTVTARDAAGNTSTDVLTVTYAPPLRITSLTADRPAPQPLGTTVTFTAVGAGDTGPYEYQWRVYDGAKWVTASAWSTSNQFVWRPTKATSLYQVRAVVRSATLKTAMSTMPFAIVP
jgi:hypothetical protein